MRRIKNLTETIKQKLRTVGLRNCFQNNNVIDDALTVILSSKSSIAFVFSAIFANSTILGRQNEFLCINVHDKMIDYVFC